MTQLKHCLLLFALLLAACAKLTMPEPGEYRATVAINGGEIPLQLRVATENGTTQVWLLQNEKALPATEVQVKDNNLYATLPAGAGQLKASISRNTLKGDLQLTDPQGKVHHFPFSAQLNKTYRFVEQSSTDNADISGFWQLTANSPDHFSTPVTLHLKQSFDAIDGKLIINQSNETLTVYGQAHGDEVYFGSIGLGRALLFKGRVNTQGQLEGQLWINASTGAAALATAIKDVEPETQDGMRQVALPWAVPTR